MKSFTYMRIINTNEKQKQRLNRKITNDITYNSLSQHTKYAYSKMNYNIKMEWNFVYL